MKKDALRLFTVMAMRSDPLVLPLEPPSQLILLRVVGAGQFQSMIGDVSGADRAPTNTGPLLQWLLENRERKRSQSAKRTVAARRPGSAEPARQNPSKRAFLLEFECLGDLRAACQVAACTVYDLRHWRTTDPMFRRDFALAALAHVRDLKRMVQEVADGGSEEHAEQARALLRREHEFVGQDERLDLRAWRDTLKSFLEAAGIDPTVWEPSPI